jgi:hypothetical protein
MAKKKGLNLKSGVLQKYQNILNKNGAMTFSIMTLRIRFYRAKLSIGTLGSKSGHTY